METAEMEAIEPIPYEVTKANLTRDVLEELGSLPAGWDDMTNDERAEYVRPLHAARDEWRRRQKAARNSAINLENEVEAEKRRERQQQRVRDIITTHERSASRRYRTKTTFRVSFGLYRTTWNGLESAWKWLEFNTERQAREWYDICRASSGEPHKRFGGAGDWTYSGVARITKMTVEDVTDQNP